MVKLSMTRHDIEAPGAALAPDSRRAAVAARRQPPRPGAAAPDGLARSGRSVVEHAGARPSAHPAGFAVSCAGCACPLLTVARIGAPEIAVLEDHLRVCGPTVSLGEGPVMLGDILRGLRVAAVGPA